MNYITVVHPNGVFHYGGVHGATVKPTIRGDEDPVGNSVAGTPNAERAAAEGLARTRTPAYRMNEKTGAVEEVEPPHAFGQTDMFG